MAPYKFFSILRKTTGAIEWLDQALQTCKKPIYMKFL